MRFLTYACGQTDKLITIFHSPTEGEVIRSVTARPSVMWYFPIYALGIICLSYNHKIAVFKNVLQPQLFKLFESNHGLRGSGSPVLTVTGFVNGRGQFSTPHRIHLPWPITKKFVASDYVGDPYGCAKFGANPSTGGFWANGWNITKFYLFIPFFHQLTYRSDPSTDFHAWWL